MKTVAIISEYNPIHNGHLYQIQKIREAFGDDTAIIAVMSGNFVQRGEPAIIDKWKRAEFAVKCGVDLVLEIPFPYSISSAEFFARAGVEIASAIGADVLSFGSECASIERLTEVAENMLTDEFKAEFKSLSEDGEYINLGHPALCELAYKRLFNNEACEGVFLPNNILALEYIKAIILSKSTLTPHTIKREGAGYNEEVIIDSPLQSATAIRELLRKDAISATKYIPNVIKDDVLKLYHNGELPCDFEALSSVVLSHFRLTAPLANEEIHDAKGGLYNRLKKKSLEATSISSLIELVSTKKFTTARIKRAIWCSLLGVTSSDVKAPPAYTQALAMNSVGAALLKRIKKMTVFPVITKPSAYSHLSAAAIRQKELSDKSDSIFELSCPIGRPGNFSLKSTPFVKK